MTRKRALIVDDSKSARVILSRMLEKYDIEVEMAESAEQSIEYLKHNRPDAIFMDHLMPGMDGLEAVQAIKSNPQTAMIPIMMYTSQEGELYVGQARALGAMGVLPKQVRPVDVSKVLYELHLLPDRRDGEEPALQPVELDVAAGAKAAAPAVAAAVPAAAADSVRRLEIAIKDQAIDLRRFIVASLDSFASRVVSDVRDTHQPAKGAVEPAPAPMPEPLLKPPWPWIWGCAAACLFAAVFAALWLSARQDLANSRVEAAGLAAANAALGSARKDLADTVKDLTRALNTAASASAVPNPAAASASSMREAGVPYGEIPLDRGRLDALRALLSMLVAQGFHGVVKVMSYAGQFCLTGTAADGYVPANPALAATKCDAIGNPFEDSLSGQQRQSLAFGNLVAGVRERSGGAISVAIVDGPSSRVAQPYPPRTETLTAGEWNKAAAANNRVEFKVEPGAGP